MIFGMQEQLNHDMRPNISDASWQEDVLRHWTIKLMLLGFGQLNLNQHIYRSIFLALQVKFLLGNAELLQKLIDS